MLPKLSLALALLALSLQASARPLQQREASPGIIEDLLTGILTPITQLIKDVLSEAKSAIDDTKSSKPLTCSLLLLGSDRCCVWWDVSAELTKQFVQSDGQCNDNARAAVRMGFHDAGSWDNSSTNGGADGSLLMDFGEQNRAENNGLQSIRTLLRTVKSKYGVGYADLAQYAHNHATISCPKGPRVRTFVGRKDATQAAPNGLMPDVHDSADNLIALFQRKGFSAYDLAALVGAHSTSRQRFVDTTPAAANKPLDTTIGVWDVNFYNDTLNNPAGTNASQIVYVLPSDKVLSTHPLIKDEWKSFVGNQPDWNEDYATAYVRMSLLGVQNLGDLVDCTKTLPASRKQYP
ncbi:ligninase LG6 precursor [Clathrospora elynae]|uniref:Peroxidase n=1 Tax=Clathrospora elynae TaxID=706981 RepID=A0A6A5T3Z5_9PLEO|nr:ligninase LG6 precursor [Clathrospora elynae]